MLEYGIGNGRVALGIARANVEIVGVDLSRSMLDDLAAALEKQAPKLRERVSFHHGDMRKVETCHVCLGYLKTVTTLTARASADVVVEDAATVAYDVAAIEAGFARPAKSGHPLGARIEARRRSGLLGFRR